MDDVRLFDLLFTASVFAALGGFARSLLNGVSLWASFLNAVLAGFFMSAAGVVSYRMGVSDDVIFYCSGLVGSFAHFAFNWVFAFLAGLFQRVSQEWKDHFNDRLNNR